MSTTGISGENRDETSLPALWQAARWFMRWLIGVCGTPCALVTEPFLSRKERREILHWLHPVETIVRRLLVAEAARMAQDRPHPNESPYTEHKPRARPRFCRVSFPDPENSAGWAVRFSVAAPPLRPSATHFCPRARDPHMPAHVLAPAALALSTAQHQIRQAQFGPEALAAQGTFFRRPRRRPSAGNPWRLARRMEAVLRVLEKPEAYARRLARRLHRDAARLVPACRPPPRPPGERPPYGHNSLIHASEHALRALAAFRDESPPMRNQRE